MLDAVHPWGREIRPFLPKTATAVVAKDDWQVKEYFRLREQIFGIEQGLFVGSDRDEKDEVALPIVALSQTAGVAEEVVGVVRIYPDGGDTWYGGRLGVSPDHRRVGAIGTALITCAVSTAHALGCGEFLATVQDANVRYFERHDFHVVGRLTVQGRPHALMEARLSTYPASLASAPVFAQRMGRTRAA